ncbi:hypothetical protein APHAL10511_000735 [Amanita phalloides]|nr:hypothetical protein APHAL10511_000735 [Amanita phalloides]
MEGWVWSWESSRSGCGSISFAVFEGLGVGERMKSRTGTKLIEQGSESEPRDEVRGDGRRRRAAAGREAAGVGVVGLGEPVAGAGRLAQGREGPRGSGDRRLRRWRPACGRTEFERRLGLFSEVDAGTQRHISKASSVSLPDFPASMGRRKIEIQPILHERNRAVTFLKRKNGLFKKAYELGVLCSVDVAVIIFEERPGHHLKLYQYCSTDIQDMVQRHLRYEGEKDTRGPADFSGNTTKQIDDTGDGDDDDADDDDGDGGVRGTHKRRGDGRMKQPPPLGLGGELAYSRIAMPTQPPMSMPGLQPPGSSSSLPISRDRETIHGGTPTLHPAGHNKRPRVEPPGHSRSSSDDPSGPGASYFGSSSYRQPSYHAGSAVNHHQYGSYFVSSQASPPPSFIPLQPEYSGRGTASPAQAASATAPGGGGGTHYGAPGRAQYDPSGLYTSSMIRHPHTGQQQHDAGSAGGNNMYPVFPLDTDGQQQQQRQGATTTQSSAFGLEWPVHSSTNAAASVGAGVGGAGAGAPSGPASSVSTASSAAPSSAGGDPNWLDFLSANNPNAGGGGPGGGGGGGEPPRSSMSWERGHEVPEIFTSSGGTSSGTGTGAGAGAGTGGAGGVGGAGGGGGDNRPGSGRGGGGTSPISGKRSRGLVEGHGDVDEGTAQGASGHPSSKMKKR